MPNPRPDFAQFAEHAARTAEYWRKLAALFPNDQDRVKTYELTASDYEQAERHARLLEKIQTWASQSDPSSDSDWAQHGYDAHTRAKLEVLKLLSDDRTPMPISAAEVRAHIRSLLEQG